MGKQIKFWFLAVLTTLMVLTGGVLQMGEPLMAAQTDPVNAIAIADQLYAQYPAIPEARQANTTLLSRFIDYHLDTKARPGQYHLDWELSMADYLGRYYGDEGAQSMATLDQDAMQRVSLQQRHALVHTLEQLCSHDRAA